jgi:FKBP-type peptidyl-prolyl cis-trans isomerase (trigger factor)
VPHSIVHAIIAQMIEETQQENTRRGFPANYGIDEEAFHDRNFPMAEARAKWMLLREKLVEAENLEATDEDFEKLAEEEGAKYGLPKENLLKYYRKYDTVKNRIVSEKLGTMLRERVKVI